MRGNEGIIGIKPSIKKLRFEQRGKMSLYLEDGRIIITPIKYFPSIAKLTPSQRRRYTVADGEVIMFRDSNEVFHIEQFLGRQDDYLYPIRIK